MIVNHILAKFVN